MPQLDILSYSTQLIWMVITFGILYIFIEKWLVPRIEEIIKVRKYKLGMNKEGEILSKEIIKDDDLKLDLNKFKLEKKKEKINKGKIISKVKKKYLKEIVKKIMKINKKI